MWRRIVATDHARVFSFYNPMDASAQPLLIAHGAIPSGRAFYFPSRPAGRCRKELDLDAISMNRIGHALAANKDIGPSLLPPRRHRFWCDKAEPVRMTPESADDDRTLPPSSGCCCLGSLAGSDRGGRDVNTLIATAPSSKKTAFADELFKLSLKGAPGFHRHLKFFDQGVKRDEPIRASGNPLEERLSARGMIHSGPAFYHARMPLRIPH